MNAPIPITITSILVGDLLTGNDRMPIDVQRQGLDDARNEEDSTIREWVDAPGVQYVPVDMCPRPGAGLVDARARAVAAPDPMIRWTQTPV